ncbi:NAD(P)H-binding protein, partial [Escherichia coli]|uniref:NAD(P)H-binding protein n=1 Tax=Escherichia coli TaxID=562 RepID=UPI001C56395B|nr:NAD(P)H-binding protein [Escherichia coli]
AARLALVTGATGYIGGRLVPRLLEAGFRVRVLVRDPRRLTDVPWRDDVEVVQGDLSDASTLVPAVQDVDVLYYLVHGMGS